MNRKEFSTTLQDRRIYASLINLNSRTYPRTQTQVAARLGLATSSVSDSVKKLMDMEMIALREGYSSRSPNKMYRPGKNHAIIEEYIKIDNVYFGRQMDAYGQGITPPESAIPYVPVSRVHLNGGWIWYDVEDEGILGTMESKYTGFKLKLFDLNKISKTNGDTFHYRGSVSYGGSTYSLHYIRSGKGTTRLGVSPPELIMTAEQVKNSEDHVDAFADQVAPLLRVMEKYGGWKIAKDPWKNYLYDAKTTVEYALDGLISNTMHDAVGEIGVPGNTPLWTDKSPTSLGADGEAECKTPDLAYTLMTADKLAAQVQDLDRSHSTSAKRLEEFIAFTDEKFERIMDNQEGLASLLEIQSRLALLSAGETPSLDMPIAVSDDDLDGGMYR